MKPTRFLAPGLLVLFGLLAAVPVQAQPSWGTVDFRTRSLAIGLDAPVYQADGRTPLDGAAYLGALYGDMDAQKLTRVAGPIPFTHGYLVGGKVLVPQVPEGAACFFQIRAWEAAYGSTYEEALEGGGATGVSVVISVVTGGDNFVPPVIPAPLQGLQPSQLVPNPRPRIVEQPVGVTVYETQSAVFNVVVGGAEPLSYQWQREGIDIPGATAAVLTLPAVTSTDAGGYRVVVGNAYASRTSATAVLTVKALPPGATLSLGNRNTAAGLDAPVFDLDGTNRIAGSGFVAQLFAGANTNDLAALGTPQPFLTGPDAGYWQVPADAWVAVPGVQPGSTVWVQARVWEVASGQSYEEALANGGRVGTSEVFSVIAGGMGSPSPLPAVLSGLKSFHLVRLPQIVSQPVAVQVIYGGVAKFEVGVDSASPTTYQWQFGGIDIPGAVGATYTIAQVKMADAGDYRVVVGNTVGAVTSAPATLTVTTGLAGGTVNFTNRRTAVGLDAPVFDLDGTTRLGGPEYVAQLYGGRSAETLVPVGNPERFLSGAAAGYWDPAQATRRLDTVLAGEPATVCVCVWEWQAGTTFEAAVAAGGKHGRSKTLVVVTGGGGSPPAVPADLIGLESFRIAQAPVFLRQPLGGTFYRGQSVRLEVQVSSVSPVTLEWYRNGALLPDATSAALGFTATTETAGVYHATASNLIGTTASSDANVVVLPPADPGASVHFSNRQPAAGLDAPVFDTDGTTRLEGAGYVAQLYAGASADAVAPIGKPAPFGTGPDAGYWTADVDVARILEGFAPGSTVFVQVRVWELALGASYEEARLARGKVGFSDILEVETGGAGNPPAPPAILLGLRSFRVGTLPWILTEPKGATVSVGNPAIFNVSATGTAPMTYQWRFNGLDIVGATNVTLALASVQTTDAGSYTVRVANFIGTVVSVQAVLDVRRATSGGLIVFGNRVSAAGIDAPCYDADGVTRLAGPTFSATLYAGPTPESLSPAARASFLSGVNAGYYPTSTVQLTNVAPNETAYVRVDIAGPQGWASSEVLAVTAGGGGTAAAPLRGLRSLRLMSLPSILYTPYDLWVREGGFTYLTVEVAPNAGLVYQWQTVGPLGAWTDIVGTTTDTLAAPNTAGTTNSYRLRVSNPVGTVFSDSITVTVLPVVRLGSVGPREFTLRLGPGAGPTCVLEGSTNLVQWSVLTAAQVSGPELQFSENPFFATNDLCRFYRARDPSGSNVVSENIAGFVPIQLVPGLNFIVNPLTVPDTTVGALLGDLPDGSVFFQYYPPPIGFTVNGKPFGQWDDPTERLEAGIGAIVQTPPDAIYVLTLAGDVPRGTMTNTLPAGWNLRGSTLPKAGQLDTDLGCPLERGDIVVRCDPIDGLLAYIYTEFGWLTEPAVIQPGEAFWIWKKTPRSWTQKIGGN